MYTNCYKTTVFIVTHNHSLRLQYLTIYPTDTLLSLFNRLTTFMAVFFQILFLNEEENDV